MRNTAAKRTQKNKRKTRNKTSFIMRWGIEGEVSLPNGTHNDILSIHQYNFKILLFHFLPASLSPSHWMTYHHACD